MSIVNVVEEMRGKTLADLGEGMPDEVRNKTPEELQTLVKVLDAHLRSIHQEETGELRDLSYEEDQALRYGLKVREAAMARIEEHRALSEVFSRRPAAVKQVYANLSRGIEDNVGVVRLTNMEARDAAMRRLEERRSTNHLKTDEVDQVARRIDASSDVARRILVTETPEYRSAWMKLVSRPDGAMLLTEDERQAMRAYDEYRAVSEGGTGGLGVPVFIDPSIILTAQGSGNPFLQIATVTDITTNVWKGVSSAGVSWSFDAEGNEVSDDSPTLAQPTVTPYTARGFIPYSIEVGQDYPNFANEMSKLLAEGYDELLIDKFTRGAGSTEPNGVLTVLSASASNRVAIQTSGQAFGSNDPYAIYEAVPARFRRKASWLMSINVNNKMRQLGGSNVYHAFTESLPAAWADVILGRSAYESTYMPNTTTSTSDTRGLAVLGDFSQYRIARRAGMNIELISHLFHTSTNLPSGQRGWFAYARIGGNVINTSAFRLLVNT